MTRRAGGRSPACGPCRPPRSMSRRDRSHRRARRDRPRRGTRPRRATPTDGVTSEPDNPKSNTNAPLTSGGSAANDVRRVEMRPPRDAPSTLRSNAVRVVRRLCTRTTRSVSAATLGSSSRNRSATWPPSAVHAGCASRVTPAGLTGTGVVVVVVDPGDTVVSEGAVVCAATGETTSAATMVTVASAPSRQPSRMLTAFFRARTGRPGDDESRPTCTGKARGRCAPGC